MEFSTVCSSLREAALASVSQWCFVVGGGSCVPLKDTSSVGSRPSLLWPSCLLSWGHVRWLQELLGLFPSEVWLLGR